MARGSWQCSVRDSQPGPCLHVGRGGEKGSGVEAISASDLLHSTCKDAKHCPRSPSPSEDQSPGSGSAGQSWLESEVTAHMGGARRAKECGFPLKPGAVAHPDGRKGLGASHRQASWGRTGKQPAIGMAVPTCDLVSSSSWKPQACGRRSTSGF